MKSSHLLLPLICFLILDGVKEARSTSHIVGKLNRWKRNTGAEGGLGIDINVNFGSSTNPEGVNSDNEKKETVNDEAVTSQDEDGDAIPKPEMEDPVLTDDTQDTENIDETKYKEAESDAMAESERVLKEDKKDDRVYNEIPPNVEDNKNENSGNQEDDTTAYIEDENIEEQTGISTEPSITDEVSDTNNSQTDEDKEVDNDETLDENKKGSDENESDEDSSNSSSESEERERGKGRKKDKKNNGKNRGRGKKKEHYKRDREERD